MFDSFKHGVAFLQTLISKHLDRRYVEKQLEVEERLKQQTIGVQLGTDGWKRKHVNDGQKLLNFIANFPTGGTAFLGFADTQGAVMDHQEFLRITNQEITSLDEKLGSVEKVLGCITDREAAVQVAFRMLEDEHHWMVNLVCQVRFFTYHLITKALCIEDTHCITMLVIKELLEPILALLQSLEQDKPLMSQCLPAWYSVYVHIQSRAEQDMVDFESIKPVLRKRFVDKCYHPAMAAAFLLDPVYYKKDSTSTKYIPDEALIDKLDRALGIDIWRDARKVNYKAATHQCSNLSVQQSVLCSVHRSGIKFTCLVIGLMPTRLQNLSSDG